MKFYKTIWKSEGSGETIEAYLRASDRRSASLYLKLRLAKESKILELAEVKEENIPEKALTLNFSLKKK